MSTSKIFSVKKGLAAIVILVLVVLTVAAGGVVYWQFKSKTAVNPQPTTTSQSISTPVIKSTPAPDETVYTDTGSANWKTLYDSDGSRLASLNVSVIKYSYKYPEKFTIFTSMGVDSYHLLETIPEDSGSSFDIYTYLTVAGESTKSWESKIKAKLGGEDAERLYGVDQNPNGPTIIYQINSLEHLTRDKTSGFNFRCAFSKTPTENSIKLCDQIASTFKFLSNNEIKSNSTLDQVVKSDFSRIQSALELYKKKNQKYPPGLENLKGDYIKDIPVNSFTKGPYKYEVTNCGGEANVYTLSTKLSDLTNYRIDFPPC